MKRVSYLAHLKKKNTLYAFPVSIYLDSIEILTRNAILVLSDMRIIHRKVENDSETETSYQESKHEKR